MFIIGWFMVFIATFNNSSVILWWSVEETTIPEEDNRPVVSRWKTVSHNVGSIKHRHERSDRHCLQK